jgi:hypothetical protein
MRRWLGLMMLGVLCVGCASQVGAGRATTLPKGAAKWGPFLDVSVVGARLQGESPIQAPWPQLGLAYHRGLSSRFEAGGRAWVFGAPNIFTTMGAALDFKLQLTQPDGGLGWDVALLASPTYQRITLGGAPSWHVAGVTAPLLFGWNLGPHQLVLGPRVGSYLLTSYGQTPIHTFWTGASAGFMWKVSKSLELQPELVLHYSPISFGEETADTPRKGASVLSLGLGLAWDA